LIVSSWYFRPEYIVLLSKQPPLHSVTYLLSPCFPNIQQLTVLYIIFIHRWVVSIFSFWKSSFNCINSLI
jgi:hypothetical protein